MCNARGPTIVTLPLACDSRDRGRACCLAFMLPSGTAPLAILLRGLARGQVAGRLYQRLGRSAPSFLLCLLFGAMGRLFGCQLATQFDLLAETLPQGPSQFVYDFGANPLRRLATARSRARYATEHGAALFGSCLYRRAAVYGRICFAAQPERYGHGPFDAHGSGMCSISWGLAQTLADRPIGNKWSL
jgi:hypothetical protein